MEITVEQPKTVLHPAVQELVEGYSDVFKEPEGLPPSRSHDHNITLKDEAKPTSDTATHITKRKRLRSWSVRC
jgi:hypothetical protein